MSSSYPTSDEVVDDLGDKVVGCFYRAISRARADLAVFRRTFPGWLPPMAERDLACFIHARMWANLVILLDNVPGVTLVDEEPIREVWVGARYQIRFKRHDRAGLTRSYPTQLALEFQSQDFQDQLPGLERVRLNVGYLWKAEDREMGEAVMSLPEKPSSNYWLIQLPAVADDAAAGSDGVVRLPDGPRTGPSLPEIEIGGEVATNEEEGNAP